MTAGAPKLLSTVTDPSGRTLSFTWTNFGTAMNPIQRLTQVQGPSYGVPYEYDANFTLWKPHLALGAQQTRLDMDVITALAQRDRDYLRHRLLRSFFLLRLCFAAPRRKTFSLRWKPGALRPGTFEKSDKMSVSHLTKCVSLLIISL